MEDMQKDIQDIKRALLGDEYGNDGFVKRLEKVESFQSKIKRERWILLGGFTTIITLLKLIWK